MLRKYSNNRSLSDNIKLGTLTAFSAGMVNISSLLLFFSFSSNITGHYAILASEIVKGNFYQMAIVFAWIFAFFLGSFTSNFVIIHFNQKKTYVAHAIPLVLEILCLLTVGVYGEWHYAETLTETEILLTLMLYAMGLQNGLTASISNLSVKTTHLTGTTTDLGILSSMFTKKEYRENKALRGRAKLLSAITSAYIIGAILSGFTYIYLKFKVFYVVSLVLVIIIFYDLYRIRFKRYFRQKLKLKPNWESLKSQLKLLNKKETVTG